MSQPDTKVYAASKVSEYTHSGQGGHSSYRVDESSGVPAHSSTIELEKKLAAVTDIDFKRKHTLKNNSQEQKAEYKTTNDALKELSPFKFRQQLRDIKTLTPEEYEAILDCADELKANAKTYSLYLVSALCAFTYWQRRYLPRSFYFVSLISGVFAGSAYGSIKTGWYFVERIDALGKDYEISRMMKQDIFDTRPDMDAGTRAQYYMY